MYILVAGDDEVAVRIAEGLTERHEVVLIFPGISPPPARAERVDAKVVQGPIASRETLEDAHVSRADYFVAATDYDEQNIVACLSARRMGAKRTICFITHPRLFSGGTDEELADMLGIDHVVRPAEQLAAEIARIVVTPGALDVRQLLGGRISLLKAEVEEGCRLAEGPLRVHKDMGEVVLVLGHRGEHFFIPKGDTHFQRGDRVTVIGKWSAINRFKRQFLSGPGKQKEVHRAAVVGCGEVGLAVIRELEDAGWDVMAIETDRERAERASEMARRKGSVVIHGDGSDLELLEEENIEGYPILVAVTSNDEKNLLISLLAKGLKVGRIITRADALANERLFERVGIDVVLSTKGAAIRGVFRKVEGVIEHLDELERGEVHVIDVELPASFEPVALARMHPPMTAVVGAVKRNSRIIIPKGATVLRPLDHLIVFTSTSQEEQCRDFFVRHELYSEAGE